MPTNEPGLSEKTPRPFTESIPDMRTSENVEDRRTKTKLSDRVGTKGASDPSVGAKNGGYAGSAEVQNNGMATMNKRLEPLPMPREPEIENGD